MISFTPIGFYSTIVHQLAFASCQIQQFIPSELKISYPYGNKCDYCALKLLVFDLWLLPLKLHWGIPSRIFLPSRIYFFLSTVSSNLLFCFGRFNFFMACQKTRKNDYMVHFALWNSPLPSLSGKFSVRQAEREVVKIENLDFCYCEGHVLIL